MVSRERQIELIKSLSAIVDASILSINQIKEIDESGFLENYFKKYIPLSMISLSRNLNEKKPNKYIIQIFSEFWDSCTAFAEIKFGKLDLNDEDKKQYKQLLKNVFNDLLDFLKKWFRDNNYNVLADDENEEDETEEDLQSGIVKQGLNIINKLYDFDYFKRKDEDSEDEDEDEDSEDEDSEDDEGEETTVQKQKNRKIEKQIVDMLEERERKDKKEEKEDEEDKDNDGGEEDNDTDNTRVVYREREKKQLVDAPEFTSLVFLMIYASKWDKSREDFIKVSDARSVDFLKSELVKFVKDMDDDSIEHNIKLYARHMNLGDNVDNFVEYMKNTKGKFASFIAGSIIGDFLTYGSENNVGKDGLNPGTIGAQNVIKIQSSPGNAPDIYFREAINDTRNSGKILLYKGHKIAVPEWREDISSYPLIQASIEWYKKPQNQKTFLTWIDLAIHCISKTAEMFPKGTSANVFGELYAFKTWNEWCLFLSNNSFYYSSYVDKDTGYVTRKIKEKESSLFGKKLKMFNNMESYRTMVDSGTYAHTKVGKWKGNTPLFRDSMAVFMVNANYFLFQMLYGNQETDMKFVSSWKQFSRSLFTPIRDTWPKTSLSFGINVNDLGNWMEDVIIMNNDMIDSKGGTVKPIKEYFEKNHIAIAPIIDILSGSSERLSEITRMTEITGTIKNIIEEKRGDYQRTIKNLYDASDEDNQDRVNGIITEMHAKLIACIAAFSPDAVEDSEESADMGLIEFLIQLAIFSTTSKTYFHADNLLPSQFKTQSGEVMAINWEELKIVLENIFLRFPPNVSPANVIFGKDNSSSDWLLSWNLAIKDSNNINSKANKLVSGTPFVFGKNDVQQITKAVKIASEHIFQSSIPGNRHTMASYPENGARMRELEYSLYQLTTSPGSIVTLGLRIALILADIPVSINDEFPLSMGKLVNDAIKYSETQGLPLSSSSSSSPRGRITTGKSELRRQWEKYASVAQNTLSGDDEKESILELSETVFSNASLVEDMHIKIARQFLTETDYQKGKNAKHIFNILGYNPEKYIMEVMMGITTATTATTPVGTRTANDDRTDDFMSTAGSAYDTQKQIPEWLDARGISWVWRINRSFEILFEQEAADIDSENGDARRIDEIIGGDWIGDNIEIYKRLYPIWLKYVAADTVDDEDDNDNDNDDNDDDNAIKNIENVLASVSTVKELRKRLKNDKIAGSSFIDFYSFIAIANIIMAAITIVTYNHTSIFNQTSYWTGSIIRRLSSLCWILAEYSGINIPAEVVYTCDNVRPKDPACWPQFYGKLNPELPKMLMFMVIETPGNTRTLIASDPWEQDQIEQGKQTIDALYDNDHDDSDKDDDDDSDDDNINPFSFLLDNSATRALPYTVPVNRERTSLLSWWNKLNTYLWTNEVSETILLAFNPETARSAVCRGCTPEYARKISVSEIKNDTQSPLSVQYSREGEMGHVPWRLLSMIMWEAYTVNDFRLIEITRQLWFLATHQFASLRFDILSQIQDADEIYSSIDSSISISGMIKDLLEYWMNGTEKRDDDDDHDNDQFIFNPAFLEKLDAVYGDLVPQFERSDGYQRHNVFVVGYISAIKSRLVMTNNLHTLLQVGDISSVSDKSDEAKSWELVEYPKSLSVALAYRIWGKDTIASNPKSVVPFLSGVKRLAISRYEKNNAMTVDQRRMLNIVIEASHIYCPQTVPFNVVKMYWRMLVLSMSQTLSLSDTGTFYPTNFCVVIPSTLFSNKNAVWSPSQSGWKYEISDLDKNMAEWWPLIVSQRKDERDKLSMFYSSSSTIKNHPWLRSTVTDILKYFDGSVMDLVKNVDKNWHENNFSVERMQLLPSFRINLPENMYWPPGVLKRAIVRAQIMLRERLMHTRYRDEWRIYQWKIAGKHLSSAITHAPFLTDEQLWEVTDQDNAMAFLYADIVSKILERRDGRLILPSIDDRVVPWANPVFLELLSTRVDPEAEETEKDEYTIIHFNWPWMMI